MMCDYEKPVTVAIGYRFGRMTVIGKTSEKKNGFSVWRCRCDCGNEVLMDTRWIRRGTKLDCGCITKLSPAIRDLTGQRFGKLQVLEATDRRDAGGSVIWRCHCDCGKDVEVSRSQLVSGYKKSCGCLGHPPRKDYVGKRFGRLTVIAYEKKQDGQHIWRCRCDCGAETLVRQTYLQSGHTVSCGCRQNESIKDNLKLVDGTSVTILENTKARLLRTNTSGYNGVYQRSNSSKWCAQITFKGKTYYLGSYDKLEDAVQARLRGEEMYDDFLSAYYAGNPRDQMRNT